MTNFKYKRNEEIGHYGQTLFSRIDPEHCRVSWVIPALPAGSLLSGAIK